MLFSISCASANDVNDTITSENQEIEEVTGEVSISSSEMSDSEDTLSADENNENTIRSNEITEENEILALDDTNGNVSSSGNTGTVKVDTYKQTGKYSNNKVNKKPIKLKN